MYAFCVVGLLDSGHDEFESGADIFEAVGEMLLQGQQICTDEAEIQDICDLFYSTLIRFRIYFLIYLNMYQLDIDKFPTSSFDKYADINS